MCFLSILLNNCEQCGPAPSVLFSKTRLSCSDYFKVAALDVPSKEESAKKICSRPSCNVREKPSQEYFIERIIGRFERTFYDGLKRYSWLVKWEGCVPLCYGYRIVTSVSRYDVSECSWMPGDELPKPAKLIENFEIAAQAEGVILPDKPLTLLKEALDGGWDKRAY